MSKLTNEYVDYAMHKVIVDSLEKDGAICNSGTKDYDPDKTLDGGSGFRLSFTKYNQKILKYHTALKTLLGIQKANVYESVPVIDYMHPSNTSFLYTYNKDSDGKLDTTTIYAAPETGEDDLTLIENEDKFTINRAIAGESMAEHFYNAVQNSSEMNVQTSPWMGLSNVEHIYNGIRDKDLIISGEYVKAPLVESSIYSIQVNDSITSDEEAYLPATVEIQYELDSFNLNNIDKPTEVTEKGVNVIRDSFNTLIVDSERLSEESYVDFLKVDDKDFIFQNTAEDGNVENYSILLDVQDICIAVPRSSTSGNKGLSRLFVYKYVPSNNTSSLGEKYWGKYTDKEGVEHNDNTILGLTSANKGDIYYLLAYPEDATNYDPIPGSLQSKSLIVLTEDIDESTNPLKVEDIWIAQSDNYRLFIIPVSSYSSTLALTQVRAGSEIPEYLTSTYIYKTLKNYIDVEMVYTSEASGLLNGLYCTPYKRENEGLLSRVTKWKFINEQEEALKRGVSIDIGAKYYKGHLLGRGTFDSSPLKRTAAELGDAENSKFKGKAEVIFNTIQKQTINLYKKYLVDNFTLSPLYSVDAVVTKADYVKDTFSSSEAKTLLGVSTNNNRYTVTSKLLYPDKLTSGISNKAVELEDLLSYVGDCLNSIRSNGNGSFTLNLDLTNSSGPCVWSRDEVRPYYTIRKNQLVDIKEKKNCFGVVTDTEKVYEDVIDLFSTTIPTTQGESTDIYNKLAKNFYVKYEVKYLSVSSDDLLNSEKKVQDGDIHNIGIKLITPLEVFATKAQSFKDPSSGTCTPKGTFLIYPDYKGHFPENLLLVSNKNLGLEAFDEDKDSSKSLVSFVKNGKALSFRVCEIREFLPSKITKVFLTTEEQSILLDYPNGLYPVTQLREVKRVNGFQAIAISSDENTVKTYLGDKYPLASIANGEYALNDNVVFLESVALPKNSSTSTQAVFNAPIAVVTSTETPSKVGSTQEETAISYRGPAPINSQDFELGSTSLKIGAGNSPEKVTSPESLQASLKNFTTPVSGTEDLSEIDLSISKNHDYRSGATTTPSQPEPEIATQGLLEDIAAWNSARNQAVAKARNASTSSIFTYSRAGKTYRYAIVPKTATVSEERVTSAGTQFDSYIYVLEPVQFNTEGIKIYDQENNELDLEQENNVSLIPMAYPDSYFHLTKSVKADKSLLYTLDNPLDVDDLQDSIIIAGLPNPEDSAGGDSSYKKLLESSKWNGLLYPLSNMLFAENSTASSATKKLKGDFLYNIFRNWKLSGLGDAAEYTLNPLRFEDFPSLVRGLVELKPILKDLTRTGFRIPTTSTAAEGKVVTEEMVAGLLRRISQSSSVYINTFNFNSIEYDPSESLVRIFNTWTPFNSESTAVKITRPSLESISKVVSKVLDPSTSLTMSLCRELDECLGDNTPPFLVMGNSLILEDASEDSADPTAKLSIGWNANIEKAQDTLQLQIAKTIHKRALEEKSGYLLEKNAEYNNRIKEVYSRYFTDEAVKRVLGTGSKALSISPTLYLLDFQKEDIRYSEAKNEESYVGKIYSSIKKSRNFGTLLWSYAWRSMSYSRWVESLQLDSKYFDSSKTSSTSVYMGSTKSQASSVKRKALSMIRQQIQNETQKLLKSFSEGVNREVPTLDQVIEYLNTPYNKGKENPEELLSQNHLWYANPKFGKDSEKEDTPYLEVSAWIIIPDYKPAENTFTSSGSIPKVNTTLDLANPENYTNVARIKGIRVYSEEISDVSETLLRGLADFVKTCLEGTGSQPYFVKYAAGDSELTGRSNSLYYKRYQMLNNRLNLAYGTLAGVIPFIRNNKKITQVSTQYSANLIESYSSYLSNMPIAKMETLAYLPPQEATATTIQLPGKFYYAAELEALRTLISGQCVLTCSKCNIQSSCPFYSQEEVIKMYCTPAETIDFYVKDNELDLIAYVDEPDEADESLIRHYPYLTADIGDGQYETLNIEKLKNTHLYYNNILQKKDNSSTLETYVGQSLEDVKEDLEKHAPHFTDDSNNYNLGYLLGGRYGTVQKNGMTSLANSDPDFKEFNGVKLPEYQYLYDALYIKDEESYVSYGVSSKAYDVSVTLGAPGAKKVYKGQTYIKIPTSLKILAEADSEDYVYLVSDDDVDSTGARILPVIYLGQVGTLQYSFGIDLDNPYGTLSESDKNLYAQDIAQWCINYYKGNCAEDPIGDIGSDPSSPAKSINEDRDQYWMPELKKYIRTEEQEGWITVEGRPRESSGYQEPVMSPETLNEIEVVSGKPIALDYKNFLRRVSIRMYDASKAQQFDESGNLNESEAWLIPWVKDISDSGSKTLKNGLTITKDTQKAALSNMKTNLRLVVVKNRS